MNKEKYQELMLRFAKELHDVGMTDDMKKILEAQYERTPNIVAVGHEENVRKFTYVHDGYMIEAVRTIKVTVKKCK